MLRRALALTVTLCLLPTLLHAADAPTVSLWPGKAPGEQGDIGPERYQPDKPEARKVARLENVSKPEITIYKPPKEKDTGVSVLICPGGGYHILAMDLEGTEVAEWLNTLGVTGIVLKYRVPARKDRPRYEAPLQDAQRAMSIVRSRAGEWGLKPDKIGILGFSAGGHLSACTMTNYDRRSYDAVDEADKESCRPDFAVLVYGAYLEKQGGGLATEIRVTDKTPPAFLVHAGDDQLGPENSLTLYRALKTAKVPAEVHIYTSGGHGFGLRPSEHPVSHWPARCAEWMKAMKILP